MWLRWLNRLLRRRGYIMIEKALLDECIALSVAYLAALQAKLRENEAVVYDQETHTATVVTRH